MFITLLKIHRSISVDSVRKMNGYEGILGESAASDILEYTINRDGLDSRYRIDGHTELKSPGTLIGAELLGSALRVSFQYLTAEVSIPFENCIRVTWKECGTDTMIFEPNGSSLAITPDNFSYSNERVLISLPFCTVNVSAVGEISIFRGNELIRRDHPPEVSENQIRFSSTVRNESSIFGFGERALGLDLKGSEFTLWNHDHDGLYGPGDDPLYLNVPVFIDIAKGQGYLSFFNNPAKARCDICRNKADELTITFDSGGLDYFIGFGNVGELTAMISVISGKPFMPPRWALGFHQSRYSYMSTDEIREVADGFIKNDLPISAIHMDIDYMDGYRVFTFNDAKFHDLTSLSEDLKLHGIKLVTIIDPGVKNDPNYFVYKEGIENNFFVRTMDGDIALAPVWPGYTAFPDFTKEEVRKWWSRKYSFYRENGITGFWHDMNEPATFTLWGDNSLPMATTFEKGRHMLIHNLYALYMAKGVFENLTESGDSERPFILSRSGWAGIQKYAFVWTGDTKSTWAQLQATVSTILNLSLSGIPYTGVDIGGFGGSPSPTLFLRWFQMASFFPLFRVHSAKGTEMREPWRFEGKILESLRKFLKLRYALIPYYYTLCYETHRTGYPIIRPAFWIDSSYDHADDRLFMVGNSILVIPVTNKNMQKSLVRLPEGNWFSIWDDKEYSGAVEFTFKEDSIPVFVKEGSIIPMEEDGNTIIHIYCGTSGSGSLYADDSRVSAKSCIYNFSLTSENERSVLHYEGNDHGLGLLERLTFRLHCNHSHVLNSTQGAKLDNGDLVVQNSTVGTITID